MTLQQITANDIAGWDSLQDIANSFEKRGLKPRPNLGEDNQLVLQLADDEFVVLVNAGPGESATDFKPDNRSRHTNLVATNDFDEFTFLTRMRTWEGQQHGRIKHQKISFTKDQFTRDSGEKNTVLKKLNSIEYGSSTAIYDTLYDTQQVVEEFYEEFEGLRTDLVQEVSGIPDDRGDAKQRYVQVVLDRMIFLYFIQEKRLLDRNPNYLHEQPGEVVDDGEDRYENFYRPLFFDYLAEDKQNPDFGSLPYLNGGLFAKNPVEEDFSDAKLGESAEETNELFDDILDFLSGWNWNVDERLDIVDPKNLSPAILGHIFEQTVNQKEMGAYYTPEEITGFMSRRTIHPYLLDQLNDTVDAEYSEVDDVFGFPTVEAGGSGEAALADGGTMTRQVPTENVETKHVETLYHDILKEVHVLDPAVGSGAFLLAAQDVLVDIYMQCIEYFQQLESEGKGWELDSRTRDELEEVNKGQGGASLYAKRTVILNNLYGVDIDQGAVEICKLRLWLSMVADIEDEPSEVEPLPNIDFNIRQGNSLIGFTKVDEVATEEGDASLSNYGGGAGTGVKEMYNDVIEAIERHQSATSSQDATNARRLAESRIEGHSKRLDQKILEQFHNAGVEDVDEQTLEQYYPFHWVLEFAPVYRDGGFDVVIGNPPWEVLSPNRHDFFSRYDETFRQYNANQKDAVEENLLQDPEIAEEWKKHKQTMERRADYFNKSQQYTLQSPTVAGRAVASENDLSALFLERTFELASSNGEVSLILPGFVFNGAIAKDLRSWLLENTSLATIVGFENKGIFDNIDDRYRFGILTFKNSGSTDYVRGLFGQNNLDILKTIDAEAVEIPKRVLANYSPEAGIFPGITSQREADVLYKILSHPPIGNRDGFDWWADLMTKELHEPTDRGRFVESPEEGDYPVLEGENIYQFSHTSRFVDDLASPRYWSKDTDDPEDSARARVREKAFNKGYLKKSIYESFGGKSTSKSQIQFVDELLEEKRGKELSETDILPDYTEYRIGYRKISNSTNERTMVATVIPKGAVCIESVQLFRPYELNPEEQHLEQENLHNAYERIFTDRELFCAVGLINSIPFDFLMRTKIETNMVKYKVEETQVPRLTKGDNWFQFVSNRAAKLNCYGDDFAEMRSRLGGIEPATSEEERMLAQAELDAAAFHAYGLEPEEAEFVLKDFHRVTNPRIMTEDYFDTVFEKYKNLEEEGPKP
ncbi:Eco57I restriction-modification methylase domain-containing protein [Halobellus salinisoli]|uniref:Eco57I restriction-modification methylase domain-containing protein n=1 Tax=Halobellus salinisoli TaxID=3108500 RepID=UPI0030086055